MFSITLSACKLILWQSRVHHKQHRVLDARVAVKERSVGNIERNTQAVLEEEDLKRGV